MMGIMMKAFLIILIAAMQSLIVVCVFFLIKTCNAFSNRQTIIDAIYHYQVARIMAGLSYDVDYSDMESYGNTLYRVWDWSNKRILPEEKYEIIKEYLKRGGAR